MKYLDLLYGFLIGLAVAIIGGFLFLYFWSSYNLFLHFKYLLASGILGGVLKLGAILNLGVFFLLLKYDKDTMAKGIIGACLVLTILAFFI